MPINDTDHEPGSLGKAVQEQRGLIAKDLSQFQAYKELRRIYMDSRQYDKAWCMCAALHCLQRADAEESAFFTQYQLKGLARAKARLTDPMWDKYVYHPDEDRFVSSIFDTIHIAVGMMKSAEHKQFGLKRKQRHNLATDPTRFSNIFSYVMEVLNLPVHLELFVRPKQAGELLVANCREKRQFIPSIVVGSSMLAARDDKELAFPIAVFLSKLRPEHYLRQIISTNTELAVAFFAAVRLVAPQIPMPVDKLALIEQYMAAMREYLPQVAVERLQLLVPRIPQANGQPDMAKWTQAVDLTAHRVGLIITNDLSLSARLIGSEPTAVGRMGPQDKLKELVLYAISPEYFELRQLLGIAIQ